MQCPYCGHRSGIVRDDTFECGECDKQSPVSSVQPVYVVNLATGVALGIGIAILIGALLVGAYSLLRLLAQ